MDDRADDPLVGTVLADRFEILAPLGDGGMGRVYRARQAVLRREVAIKLLHPRTLADPKALRRFEREARAACRIQHPNITQVLDFGHDERGVPYLVMELVSGPSLREVMDGDDLCPVARAVTIMGQAASALEAVRRADVVHRDLKPQNILLATDDEGREQVKILDFGISRIRGPDATVLTTHGVSLGTPEYMSPEQVLDEPPDHRSDLYSLGVVIFELLSGRPPFEGSVMQVMNAHVSCPPPHLATLRPDLPPALDALILRCLAKAAEDRFQTGAELQQALSACGGP